ncbi:MAG: glycosyltransferase [Arthrobacter sp.]|uniref:glycosyltransferase n=1 Tax=Arthrobacter sp. TaxID=1667 RepID=UPI003490D97B
MTPSLREQLPGGAARRSDAPEPARGAGGGLRIAMLSLHTSPLAQPGSGDAGGMNVYVRQLAAALAGRGVGVDIFTRAVDGTGTTVLGNGVTVHHMAAGPEGPLSKERLPEFLPEIVAAIQRCCSGRFDLIHSHYWMSGLAGLELARDWGVPLVHTMHTMGKVKRRHHADADEPDVRLSAELRLVAESARITANTPAEVRELVSLYSADPSTVDVVPPGVDLGVFRPDGPREWRGFPGGAPDMMARRPLRLLFAGRIQKLKGPHILVRALGMLDRTRPDLAVELAVIGARSGAPELNLHRLVAEERVERAVGLLPPVPPDELAGWFRGADLVAVPSYSESFGLVAMEAQACGTPVLAHDVGGLRHTVLDGETGVLLPDLDPARWATALAGLADAPERLAAYGEAAARHAARFDWARTAEAALGSYGRALSAMAGRPEPVRRA